MRRQIKLSIDSLGTKGTKLDRSRGKGGHLIEFMVECERV